MAEQQIAWSACGAGGGAPIKGGIEERPRKHLGLEKSPATPHCKLHLKMRDFAKRQVLGSGQILVQNLGKLVRR